MNVPATDGVPLMVMVLLAKEALTPAGKFIGAPIPVAPVVAWVIENVVPMHTGSVDEGGPTVFAGLTVMLNGSGVPGQPLAVGVTVTVAVMAVVPMLVAGNDAILPLPEAPKPIAVLLFPHANVVPVTGDEKLIAPLGLPAQRVMLLIALTVGFGFATTIILSHLVHEAAAGNSLSITLT